MVLTLAGKVANSLSSLISLKWLSLSKLEARSEASRQNEKFYFYRLRINYEPVMTMCVGVKN